MMIDDYVCVFCQVNDARLMIVGDEDELLCLYVFFSLILLLPVMHFMRSFLTVLSDVVFKDKITISAFLENYPKTCLAVKEMVVNVCSFYLLTSIDPYATRDTSKTLTRFQ